MINNQPFNSKNTVENTVKDINIGSSLFSHLDFRIMPDTYDGVQLGNNDGGVNSA